MYGILKVIKGKVVDHMKNITTETEKRINKMVKSEVAVGKELAYMLRELKCRESCDGVTVSEMKKWGITMENATQINCFVTPIMRGMSVNFESLFNAVTCLGLSYVTITDFNGLVRECYDRYMKA